MFPSPSFTAEIENNAALVGVGVDEGQTPLAIFDVAGERRQQPVGIAAGRFHLDHIRAQIGKPARRIRCRNVAELDNSKMTESVFVTAWKCHYFHLCVLAEQDSAHHL